MKKNLLSTCSIAVIFSILLNASVSSAITIVSVSPTAAMAGQSVTAVISASTLSILPCSVMVNFGDGSPALSAGSCSTHTPCQLSANHVYTSAGSYVITASDAGGGTCSAPMSASAPLTVSAAPAPPAPASASSYVSPSSFSIPHNLATTLTLSYTFSGPSSLNTTLQSGSGDFLAGGSVIATANTPLTAKVSNGRGGVTETLTIPAAVSLQAEKLGTANITFSRTFSGGGVSTTTAVAITVTSGAAAGFSITSIRLYFPNGRPEVTIGRNTRLSAFADIGYTGTGRVQGYWEVDGNLLYNVYQTLPFGGLVTMQTRVVPPLPTFVPGAHILRFVITSPSASVSLPEAVYFVTASAPGETKMMLLYPADGSEAGSGELAFQWGKAATASAYLIEFLEKKGRQAHLLRIRQIPGLQSSEDRTGRYVFARKDVFLAGDSVRRKRSQDSQESALPFCIQIISSIGGGQHESDRLYSKTGCRQTRGGGG